MFMPPDAENPRKAEHDGDWDAETEALARRGIYVFDRLAPAAADPAGTQPRAAAPVQRPVPARHRR